MPIYKPEYANSYALCIGIDKYKYVNPLEYAKNDADAIVSILIEKFNFKNESVKVLYDKEATKGNILSSYLEFTNQDTVGLDDRIFIFFAGHGYTITGQRGEVGFLIPYDGNTNNLSTLIRWDELTRNSELIPAKHILFIMDACFSGLAITRSLPQGSMRFLKDMLIRFVRQVITAGKANEVVADAGGPIPNHSVFTGHLLQALKGNAKSTDGSITANGVMAYVYDKVSKDEHSRQTPHFGFLDGDGDFIFTSQILDRKENEEKISKDVLVEVPIDMNQHNQENDRVNLIKLTKEYISDERYRIKLDDLLTEELRKTLSYLNNKNFPLRTQSITNEDILNRLQKYELTIKRLESLIIPLSYWGSRNYSFIIQKAVSRLTDHIGRSDGTAVWLELRWYPLLLLLYYGGISAIAVDNYQNLSPLLLAEVNSAYETDKFEPIILEVGRAVRKLISYKVFKKLPQYKRYFAPMSEYLFKILQPSLEDILFLGNSYELLFDRFEIMFALIHADLTNQKYNGSPWGPFGRFAWKHRSHSSSTYNNIKREASLLENEWPPIKAGFFNSSYERFREIVESYEELIKKLNWY